MPVGEGERGGDTRPDARDPFRLQRGALTQDRGERFALNELHDDEVSAVVLAPVEDGDDVRVGQVGGGLRLAAEALDEGPVDRELGEQHLERDGAIEFAVDGAVHQGHATACHEVGQLVPA